PGIEQPRMDTLATSCTAAIQDSGICIGLWAGTCVNKGMAEKSLNDLPRDLRVLFTRGSDALQRDNFDYAIDLFNKLSVREPMLYDARKALRTAQQRKAGGKSGLFKKLLSSASSSPLLAKAEIALRRDPAEALQTAEQILNTDPNNSAAHRLVVKAAN